MDFKDQIKQLSERVVKLKDNIQTEEATKTAFIMPMIQALGYDVFDPTEVVPEFTCDLGIKKGRKNRLRDPQRRSAYCTDRCKHWKEDLNSHNGQLFRLLPRFERSFRHTDQRHRLSLLHRFGREEQDG